MAGLFGCAAAVFVLVAFILFNGWAISLLWGWFLVPTLGVRAISVVEAIGIAMVVCYFKGTGQSKEHALYTLGGYALLLLIAWGFHAFFMPS